MNALVIVICFLFCVNEIIGKQCNVMDYGAKGDGKTNDTLSIQKAIDSCTSNDAINTILFPTNHNFLSSSFYIKYNNTELLIDATITAPNNVSSWPKTSGGSAEPLISTYENKPLNNIIISGHGLINGQGKIWWDLFKNGTKVSRPWLIRLQNIKKLNISYITLLNSPAFHMYIGGSEDVVIHNINITSPDYAIAPNTDGIDIGSKNVHVYDCYVENGDDSYCLKQGAQNVLIENSVCKGGNGIDANSEHGNSTSNLIRDVVVRNVECIQTWWGIRLKAGESPGSEYNGKFLNLTFENILFQDVQRGIDMNQFNESVDNVVSGEGVGYTVMNNITYRNITGTYTSWAGRLDCSSENPCEDLIFDDIHLKGDGTNADWSCSANVHGTVVDVSPPLNCVEK